MPKRPPSPALILSGVAVFASLGGTGYAATQITAGPSHPAKAAKKSSALTKSQANKLIAAYFKAHRGQITGAAGAAGAKGDAGTAGAPGAAGTPGVAGAAGPGAIPISANTSSALAGEQPAGTAGPWSFTLTCAPGGPATFKVHGPGTEGATTSLAVGGAAATTYVGAPGPIGGGTAAAVSQGAQMSQTFFLQSGSTLYEAKMLMTAKDGGLFEVCTVVGDAIPVS